MNEKIKTKIINKTLKETFWECTNYKPLLGPKQYKEFVKQLKNSLNYALDLVEKSKVSGGKDE